MEMSSWISPKTCKSMPSKIHNLGFFAKENINKGEILAIKAGHLISREELKRNADVICHSQMQITDDLYLAPLTENEFQDSMIYINHSCEPNVVVPGQIVFIARRDINAGEELTVDYCTIFNDELDMKCNCGAKNCREIITGDDWKDGNVQKKYGNNFAWFILQKIKQKT